MRRFTPRLTYANVVATLALFVALGGGAYAAATIGPGDIKNNAVRSNHIKDGQVKHVDLARNSVDSGKVINGSLLKRDFKAGQLPAGRPGATGPTFAAEVGFPADDPPAFPSNGSDPLSVQTPSAGKLFVFATFGPQTVITCPAGASDCTYDLGLYLDGNPVPHSDFTEIVAQNSTRVFAAPFYIFGSQASVPAGSHQVRLGFKSTSANAATLTKLGVHLGVMLFGG